MNTIYSKRFADVNAMIEIEIENDNCNEYLLEADINVYYHKGWVVNEDTGELEEAQNEYEFEEARIRPARMPKKYRVISEEFFNRIIEDYHLKSELKKEIEKAIQEEKELQRQRVNEFYENHK